MSSLSREPRPPPKVCVKANRVAQAVLCTLLLLLLLFASLYSFRSPAPYSDYEWDAIVIPGGGLEPDGTPREWIKERLRYAAKRTDQARFIIVLSRATVHRPPPRDSAGYPIDESAAAAKFLIGLGVTQQQILCESWSLDTLGNAFAFRQFLAEPLDLRRVLLISSDVHVERTRTLFQWILSLPSPQSTYRILNLQVEALDTSTSLTAEQRQVRLEREHKSMETVREHMRQLLTVRDLAEYVFMRHGAYAPAAVPDRSSDARLTASY